MFLPIAVLVVGLSDVPAAGQVAADPPAGVESRTASEAPNVSDPRAAIDTSAAAPGAAQEEQDTTRPQEPSEPKKPPTPPHTGLHALFGGVVDDFKNLPSLTNTYLVLAGGGVALAVHPFDQSLNAHLRSHYTLVNDIFAPAKYYGDTPEQVGLSMATYAWGRLFDQPKVSHLGMDLLQAQIVSEVLVDALKITVRRDRPDNSQGNWNFSFPSGHAAQTFAAATVLERHLGWRKAALAYAIALYVASSRLHDNVHYVSDVAFGAAVGSIAGRTVTRHGPNAWALFPVSLSGGGALIATRAWGGAQP
jgi:hypothetical protein